MNRERYEYQQPEESVSSAFVPIVKEYCICGPIFEHNGVWYKPCQPSCMKHGFKTIYEQPVSKLWPDQRTVGVQHSRSGSRRSV